jgi:transposase
MARPVTLHVALTAGQRADLRQRLRQVALSPRLRRRLECIRLADQGWPVPRIAARLGVHQATVRWTIRRLDCGGLDGLADRPRCGRPRKLDSRDLDAVEELLARAAARNETWTAAQLASWLARARGVAISPGRLSVLLRQRGCGWTRPARAPHGPPGAAR